MKPHVIKEIDNPDGSVYEKAEPQEIGTPVSEEVAHTVASILEQEISSGGGQNAKVEGYQFCGKTGTAQRLNAEGTGYAEGQYIGSFIGFGPYDDPQYVVLIVVDNPSGTYYGAQVAAPIFKEMMTQIVRIKGIRPTASAANTDFPKKEEAIKKRVIPDVVQSSEGILLPSFIGWDTRDVNNWLDKADLGFVPNGTGRAVYQNPAGGRYVEPGTDVHVTFMR
jgi:stage V sporulation protein D (sporulation-specific penicillin-binding protein)